MTSIEIAFLCAIYGLYLSDCIYWVGPNQHAYTRSSASDWTATTIEPLSFTLLGKRPIIAAPFLIHPAFIRTTAPANPRTLRKVAKRLNRLNLLLTLCRTQAFLFLVYLPLLIVLHRLTALATIFLAILLVLHAALSTLAIRALRRTKTTSWRTAATSIALNPLGATRALDTLSQAFFDQEALN